MKKYFIIVLKSFRGKLQYVLKNWEFYLKNLKWPCPDLNNATQSQIIGTLLCLPLIRTTFVWNTFSENASLKKYFGATFKMGHLVDVLINMTTLNVFKRARTFKLIKLFFTCSSHSSQCLMANLILVISDFQAIVEAIGTMVSTSCKLLAILKWRKVVIVTV